MDELSLSHDIEPSLPPEQIALLFENTPQEGVMCVAQGYEAISAGDWLVTARLRECTTKILVNQLDGSTLMKRIGPRSTGALAGDGKGKQPQEEYADFFDHARQLGASVWEVDISGEDSTHRINPDKATVVHAGVEIIQLPEITAAPSSSYTWDIAYDPKTSTGFIRTFDPNSEPQYQVIRLPRTNLGFDATSAESLAQKGTQRKLFGEALEALSYASNPESIERARAIVLGTETPSNLTTLDLHGLAIAWRSNFVGSVENADPEEIHARVRALKVLMDVDARLESEAAQLDLVIKRASLISGTVDDLLATRGLAARGGRALLEYLDSEINSLPGHPDDAIGHELIYLKELRSKYARGIHRDEHFANS